MSDHEAKCYTDLITGSYLWAGSPATVFVTKRTTQEARRDKVKTREYRRKITVWRLAAAQAGIKDLEMVTQKRQERATNPVARGRGMVRRADKYLAQWHRKEPERIPGNVPVLSAFSDRAATPDDYHSAWEPSESEYDTEETDPEEDRDNVEGNDDDVSVGSDTTFKSSGHDTDRTNRMTTANRTQRRNQRKRKESWGWRATNARKEDERRKGKVVLSLFRDSPKEGALTYTDWRREVEEYIWKEYDDNRIKDAMLSSVEGQAYVNFRSCDEGRNRTPAQILKEKRQKWPAHIGSIIIAYNSTRSLVTGYSPYYLMFGRRPRLPIDLLFLTRRTQTLTHTIDEYVASLYDRLRKSLVIAQDCAIKEAQRQKRLYDRKVGAVELRPGDNVLVRLDAFQGQRRKLKNRWGSDLHMVVTRVADGIPAYVMKNDRTGKKKVVHRARLLLWLADYGEPVRCNHVDTSDVPTGTATDRNPQTGCDGDNSVPGCSLQYVYMAVIEDPKRMSSRIGREVRAGAPRNVAGQMIEKPDEEECPDCLGSYSEDVPCGWGTSTRWYPSGPFQST